MLRAITQRTALKSVKELAKATPPVDLAPSPVLGGCVALTHIMQSQYASVPSET